METVDFFASQELARRNTRWLIFWLIVSLVAMIGAVYVLLLLLLGQMGGKTEFPQEPADFLWLLLWTSAAVSAVVGFGSLMKIWELRVGGPAIAEMLHGRRLPPNSDVLAERRLLNIVEEMALASGIPVPPVYVLDHEGGINAFAAGNTVDDAVIGVNRGTLQTLNRDELQGVIAHEFSHILNGDMRMSLRLIGILHGIQAIALIGYFLLRIASRPRRRSSSDKKGDPTVFLLAAGVGLLAIGSLGLLMARIIKASISRQREYLADASSVQFTRNPEGIAGALKVIAGHQQSSQIRSEGAETLSHMFFANMNGGLGASWLATHPPLLERIHRIEPQFQGSLQEYLESRAKPLNSTPTETESGTSPPNLPVPGPLRRNMWQAAAVIAGIGTPSEDDVAYSQMLIGQIPRSLIEAARDPFSARSLVYASLLGQHPGIRSEQVSLIQQLEGRPTRDETEKFAAQLARIEPRFRLPLFEVLQGALVSLSGPQYLNFRRVISELITLDQKLDLFEFFLQHHLLVHLDRHLGHLTAPTVKYNKISQILPAVAELLWVLSAVGHSAISERDQAYQAAWQFLKLEPQPRQGTEDNTGIDLRRLARALEILNESSPAVKKQVLAAAATGIAWDHTVTVEEAELFRAFAESLDCPVPPLVASLPTARA